MKPPDEQQWLRVEKLAEELRDLPPDEMASHLSRLAAAGESSTVITLVSSWLALPAPAAPLSTGCVVGGRYTLKEKIGEGGMGSIWRAEQKMVDRDVALKMIHSPLVTPDLNARFASEIKLLGRLNHPGIVQIFDAGVHEQPDVPAIPFFVMELVDGKPLGQWVASHRDHRSTLLRLMAAVCEAVQNAHERHIVHRDLKPSNILVREDGRPVVLDFGIARLAGAVAGDESGMFSGTPQYAAPEQHLGRDHDFRSGESVDVYSTGVILFEVLSGRRLHEFSRDASLTEMRRAVVEGTLPRLSDVVPDCPSFLDEIVSRALRRDPSDRFYSMAAFGRALGRAAALIHRVVPPPPIWSPSAGAIVPGTGWRLTKKLGEGGVGQVWLGMHDQLGECRVFKFCDTEEKARTLKRELTLFRLLKERIGRNPHFVPLHEVSLEEPPWYLMMDYTDARDLPSWSAEQPGGLAAVPMGVRVEIVAQVAEALQAAHEASILHRDIKPSNLLVGRSVSAGGINVLVADFGIGQIVAEEFTRLGFTRTVTDPAGTRLYMAPEVLEGNAATARSDIYSLGVVLWQLLIGNITAALDPADWASRIDDPLLRADLARCLAGLPEKRWNSAGEFAANLRALPTRRSTAARRAAELAARERLAYRRGVIRTAVVALSVVALVAALAWMALVQRKEAENARGQIALEQAGTLPQADMSAGRRERGTRLLDTAARTVTNHTALRSAAAAVFGMPDLVRLASARTPPETKSNSLIPVGTRETCRVASDDGKMMALARDVDGVNGAVEMFDAMTSKLRVTIERKQFPWVPIAESGLLRFSPDNSVVAIGGAATSRHILLCDTTNGTVRSYLFHGSDPLSCAWHPGGRIFVVGCADGSLRVWDTAAAVSAGRNAFGSNQFDLPPALDVPASDVPVTTLRGHRGSVQWVAFSGNGRWLATVDAVGYLRIHSGFSREGMPQLVSTLEGTAGSSGTEPTLAVEVRLDRPEEITTLETVDDRLTVRRRGGTSEDFGFLPSELPAEMHVAFGITQLAWNRDATELCAISLTDIHWLKASPLELFHTALGKNPIGVAHIADRCWALPKETDFVEHRLIEQNGKWQLATGVVSRLSEAVKGQGARTKLAVASDGRLAVYCGRRIQFFRDHEAAPATSAITAKIGGGEQREIFWNGEGTLLGTAVRVKDGLHLETWTTSTNFPPECHALSPIELDCERITPANRGQQYIARSVRRGILLFDANTRTETILDHSSTARQNAPIAVTTDGEFLALVANRNVIQLLKLPGGIFFAALHSRRPSALASVYWDASGHHLASIAEDGYVQVWNLAPWQNWSSRQGLEK